MQKVRYSLRINRFNVKFQSLLTVFIFTSFHLSLTVLITIDGKVSVF
jgi:hypothetical protein